MSNPVTVDRFGQSPNNPGKEKSVEVPAVLPHEERASEANDRAMIAQIEGALRDQEKRHSQTRDALSRMGSALVLLEQDSPEGSEQAERVRELIAEVHALQSLLAPSAEVEGDGPKKGQPGELIGGVEHSSSENRDPSSSSEVKFFRGHKNNNTLRDPIDIREKDAIDLNK